MNKVTVLVVLAALVIIGITHAVAYELGKESLVIDCRKNTFFSMHGTTYECLPYTKGSP